MNNGVQLPHVTTGRRRGRDAARRRRRDAQAGERLGRPAQAGGDHHRHVGADRVLPTAEHRARAALQDQRAGAQQPGDVAGQHHPGQAAAGGPDHLGPRRADHHGRPAQRPGVPADRLGQLALHDAGRPGPAAAVGREQPRHRLDRPGGQRPGPLQPDHQRRLHGEPDEQPREPGLAGAQLVARAACTPTWASSASTRTTWPRASATSAAR